MTELAVFNQEVFDRLERQSKEAEYNFAKATASKGTTGKPGDTMERNRFLAYKRYAEYCNQFFIGPVLMLSKRKLRPDPAWGRDHH